MARLICNDCENVVMFGGNVKSGDLCPKCGSENTTKGKTIAFKAITDKKYYRDDEYALNKWAKDVQVHNQYCVA